VGVAVLLPPQQLRFLIRHQQTSSKKRWSGGSSPPTTSAACFFLPAKYLSIGGEVEVLVSARRWKLESERKEKNLTVQIYNDL